MKRIFLPLLVLSLASCAYLPSEEWVHEPTESLRNNVRSYSVEGIDGRTLVVMPELLYMNDGYPAEGRSASFIVVSINPVDLHFEQVSITNRNTGYTQRFALNSVVEVNRPLRDTGYYVAWAAPLLSSANNASFVGASALRFTLWYRLPDGESRQETFDVSKETRWRWVTPPV